jgi:hypothetical protein
LKKRSDYSFGAVVALTISLVAGAAIAGETKHTMKLTMALAGIPVGKLAIAMQLDEEKYSMSGSARTYGVSRLFSRAKGFSKSSGKFKNGHIVALSHDVEYRSGKKRGSVHILFDKGRVSNTKSVPAVHYKKGTVAVTVAHLKSVLDPMSISIVAVKKKDIGNGNAICNRTVPVYDGKNRFDLQMKFKGRRKIVTRGFKGIAYVCAARYLPVAGHRPHKKHIQQLQSNKSIEITMARIGKTAVYGIIQFSARTPYGRIIGKPSYFLSTSL